MLGESGEGCAGEELDLGASGAAEGVGDDDDPVVGSGDFAGASSAKLERHAPTTTKTTSQRRPWHSLARRTENMRTSRASFSRRERQARVIPFFVENQVGRIEVSPDLSRPRIRSGGSSEIALCKPIRFVRFVEESGLVAVTSSS